ncbi:MAG: serine--tRNA ligase [Bacteroidales bacterium]|jgi:seryl-tRNA synthetase|nr:serine--tRNA ligase [Bacteroidales bacterium]
MLTLSVLKEKTDFVVERLNLKNFRNAKEQVEEILNIDKLRRKTQVKADELLAEGNKIAKEIGVMLQKGLKDEAEKLKVKTGEVKEQARLMGEKLTEIEKQLEDKLILLPNLPHESIKSGISTEDNEIVHQEGVIPELSADAMPHWDLCAKYDIVDFELGVKITGAGFPVYKGKGARLQRALINFFLEEGIKAGYLEIQPPLMVNQASGYGTGQLPDKDGQMYYMQIDDLYMIPTAEVPVTNIYRNVILKESELPKKNVAYSGCFRREAGSYGKDVRGLNRLHQFDKVEIVRLEKPENSYKALDEMVEHVGGLIRSLGLPFRILRLCGGDMSFTSALTYDFEVFSTAQQKWLEVSSTSNFESFQANRMKCRYKDETGKTQLVHTLNGSALALPRIVAALLENNQTPEGITIPEVLRKWTGFDMIN